MVDVAVHDHARALGRERREPGVLGGDDRRGREQGERSAAATLPEDHRQGRHGHRAHGADAPRDLAGDRTLLGLPGQLGPGRVDHGDQRQPELLGQRHRPPGLAQSGRPHRAGGRLLAAVLADHDAGLPVESGEDQQHRLVTLALVGAVEPDGRLAAVPHELAYAGAPLGPGALHRVPGGPARGRRTETTLEPARPRRVDEHGQRQLDHRRQVLGRDDGVDDAVRGEVLGRLDVVGERLAVQRLEDLGAEEADQGAGLTDGHVRQRAPGGEDAAGGRVPQVDEVGQAGGSVVHQRPGDLDHPDERGRPLLHAGAPRRGGREHGQSLGRGAPDGGGDPVGRRASDRAGQEAELVDQHHHRTSVHQSAAGQHRLVGAGPLRRRLELASVALGLP